MNSVNQNTIKHKVGLLNLAAELGNVSRACKVMGFSRDTFYRYQTAMAEGGVEALLDANRKKPNVRDDKPFGGAGPPAALFYYSRDRRGEHPQNKRLQLQGIRQQLTG